MNNLTSILEELSPAMANVGASLPAEARDDWMVVINFISVCQRILKKTNPSKVKDAAQVVWIQGLMPPGERRKDS